MKMAIYSCMKCGLEFESSWGGGAFLMAISCIRCDGTAVSSESFVFESGCLSIKDEHEQGNLQVVLPSRKYGSIQG
jgi:DNA-directed RNA polymerase subunit RPC12/RpoP